MRRLLLVPLAALSVAWAPVPHNPADRFLPKPVDALQYDYATHCVKRPTRGALLMAAWLGHHVRGELWGIVRCELWGKGRASLHAEGRAIDWHLDARVPADRRAARQLIALLLAPDRDGNPYALARRMGVQELIFDCQAWFGGGDELRPYSVCYDKHGKRLRHVDPTQGHVNHLHIGLNHAGAAARTSFWRRG